MRVLTALALVVLAASPAAAQRPVDPKKPAPAPAPVTGYGAWFGSIPDMDNSMAGIYLNGVTAGSPAEKAGLKAGDTLQSMTEVLRNHKPGDTITVVFQREGAEKSVAVILGVRPGS